MTFDFGSFMLGVGLAISFCWIVMFMIYRADKNDDKAIFADYRRMLDEEKNRNQGGQNG